MTKKQVSIIIVALLAVSISLYSSLKPAPVIQSEQPVKIEDAKLLKEAGKFSSKVRQLADRRSLRGLYKVSLQGSEFFMTRSVRDLKAFETKGMKIESMSNTQKEPTSYTCMLTNAAGQKGNMLLYSPNGKKWSFVAFAMDEQKSED